MRFSVSKRLFLVFSFLSLVTLTLGATFIVALSEQEKSTQHIQDLNDFKLQIKELESFNIDRFFRPTPSMSAKLETQLQKAELLVNRLNTRIKDLPRAEDDGLNDLSRFMNYYREAALELYTLYQKSWDTHLKNNSLFEELSDHETRLPGENRQTYLKIISNMEQNRDKFDISNDPALIVQIKKLDQQLGLLTNDGTILDFASHLTGNVENDYINQLAINNSLSFLAATNKRFTEIANQTIKAISTENQRRQLLLQNIVFALIGLSIFLTLLFWRLTSKRLKSFLGNQNHAIHSIKSGHFDYDVGQVGDDEFGDLIKFMKNLSLTLKDEISVREETEKEKANLQNQLLQAQKLESIGILAGGIAHDFNNLLTGIIGYADLVALKLPQESPLRRYITMITAAGRRAEELTGQLLAFSRKQLIQLQPTNLSSVIRNILNMLTRLIGEDIILKVNTSDKLPLVMADAAQLEHVLMNLVVNARDAMPEGGHLSISTSTMELDTEYAKGHEGLEPGTYALLTVKDTGQGMDRQTRDKIFDPFFTTKAPGKGTGLGLSTVFGIVKQHKGHVWVYSEPNQGTVFKIYLPVTDEQEKISELIQGSSPQDNHGDENILLVDDDETVRNFLYESLGFFGYRVTAAASGQEALQIAQSSNVHFDLLITDVIMPEINGKELADRIRRQQPKIKIIFMSGYTSQTLSAEEIAADQDIDFIGKPVTPTAITRKIRNLFD